MKLHYLFFGLLLLTLCALGGSARAEGTDTPANPGIPSAVDGTSRPSAVDGTSPKSAPMPTLKNPLKVNSIQDLLYTIVDVLIFIGVIIAVLMFVFIGFKFVMAQGDTAALKEARSWFLYAVIGTAILISSKVIVEVLKNTFISAGVVNADLFKK